MTHPRPIAFTTSRLTKCTARWRPTTRPSETKAHAPNSLCAASKAASDHLVRACHETYGLQTSLSNCFNNYGPWQFPEKPITLMIVNALASTIRWTLDNEAWWWPVMDGSYRDWIERQYAAR